MRRPQLGDLGTLLPLAAGLVIVSGVDACGFFVTFSNAAGLKSR